MVGGGAVAERKVRGLLHAGFEVTVISPKINSQLEDLVQLGSIEMIRRLFQEGDLQGAFLAIAATDDPVTNRAVWEEARQRGCLVNVVDDPEHSNFILPAIVRRGDLTIAISTGGASPALARRLRQELEACFGSEYGEIIELLAELRPELQADFEAGETRRKAAYRLVDSDLLEVLRHDGREVARQRAREILSMIQEGNPS